jgi:Di-haem oxidoreductase, putative peroxidase
MLRPENTAANFQGFAGNLLGLGEASLFVVIIGQVAADFDGKGVIWPYGPVNDGQRFQMDLFGFTITPSLRDGDREIAHFHGSHGIVGSYTAANSDGLPVDLFGLGVLALITKVIGKIGLRTQGIAILRAKKFHADGQDLPFDLFCFFRPSLLLRRSQANLSMESRGNDGTITRFGWKAQNKSIMIFAGEAYNVEMGVTSDLFPQATDESPNCTANKSEPNDIFRNDAADDRNQDFSNPLHLLPDWQMFAIFMRFLDAPQPVPLSASAQIGQQLFGTDAHNPGIGCVGCHTGTMITQPQSETAALQNLTVHPYSDLLIHHMGKKLADDITQG